MLIQPLLIIYNMTAKMTDKTKADSVQTKKIYLFSRSVSNAKHTKESTDNQAKTSYKI